MGKNGKIYCNLDFYENDCSYLAVISKAITSEIQNFH